MSCFSYKTETSLKSTKPIFNSATIKRIPKKKRHLFSTDAQSSDRDENLDKMIFYYVFNDWKRLDNFSIGSNFREDNPIYQM